MGVYGTKIHGRGTKKAFGGASVALALTAASLLLPAHGLKDVNPLKNVSLKSLFSGTPTPAPTPFHEDDLVTVIHPGAEFSYCTVDRKPVTRPLGKDEVLRVKTIIGNQVGGLDKNGGFGTFLANDVAPAPVGTPAPPNIAKTGHCSL